MEKQGDKIFTVFESWYRSVKIFSDDKKEDILKILQDMAPAMWFYVFDGEEPDFKNNRIAKGLWESWKETIDATVRLHENHVKAGRKGGRNGKGVTRNKGNQNASKPLLEKQKQNKSKTKAVRYGKVRIDKDINKLIEENKEESQEINFSDFLVFFNNAINETGSRVKQIKNITQHREDMLNELIKVHGKKELKNTIEKAIESPRLNGNNPQQWVATFDWIINPDNFQKIKEGNYDEKAIY